MKKKFLSTLLALTMCLTLLPTAAFADETEGEVPVCTCETACAADAMNADCPVCSAEGAVAEGCGKYAAPAQPETDEAAEAVREMISALPTAESRATLSAQEQNVAGEAAYAAFDAYGALTDVQQETLTEEYSFLMELLAAMNGEVSTLANATWDTSVLPDYSSTTMFEVSTANQLLAIATSGEQFSGKTIKLTANIDMKDVTGWKPLSGTSGFCGTFDGDGHSISNLNGTLFGTLKGATVKNLAVVDSVVSGADSKSTGILANSATANSSTPCTIQNCYVTGSVTGKTTGATTGVGGLVGLVSGKTVIQNCAANVTVTNNGTSTSYAGGLVGCVTADNDQLTIERCFALGTVTTGGNGAGGLVGGASTSNKTVTIQNSAALQSTVSSKNKYQEGRIAGRNISDSGFTNVYGYDGMTSTKQPNGLTTGSTNGTDVSKTQCGTASFWTGLGFGGTSSAWTVADGKLPKLSNLNAMSDALPSYLAPSSIVSGTVKCGTTALSGATVSFAKDGESVSATTDTGGKYSVELAAGSYTVTVSHSGYLTHVETGYEVSGAATKDFSLSANPVSLGSDKTVEVIFSTTDAADKIGKGNIPIAYSGTGTLSMNDFAVSTSADALKSYNGVTVTAVTAIA